MPQGSLERDDFAQGWSAAQADLGLSANPNGIGSQARIEWLRGWVSFFAPEERPDDRSAPRSAMRASSAAGRG